MELIGVLGFLSCLFYAAIALAVLWFFCKKAKSYLTPQPAEPPQVRALEGQNECPICLDQIGQSKVVALCSHAFCAACICLLIESKRPSQIQCPCCRRRVSFLHIQHAVPQPQMHNIQRYNLTFSEHRSWIDKLKDAPYLFYCFLHQVLDLSPQALMRNLQQIAILIGGLAYLVSPIDFIPEVIFGVIGFIDDFAVVISILFFVAQGMRDLMIEQNNRAARAI